MFSSSFSRILLIFLVLALHYIDGASLGEGLTTRRDVKDNSTIPDISLPSSTTQSSSVSPPTKDSISYEIDGSDDHIVPLGESEVSNKTKLGKLPHDTRGGSVQSAQKLQSRDKGTAPHDKTNDTHGDYDPHLHKDQPHNNGSGNDHEEGVKRYKVATIDFERVRTPIIIGLWIFAASLAKIGFHMVPRLSHIFPESCLLVTVGVVVGLIIHFADVNGMSSGEALAPNTFFLYLLPPIILDAGYFMPNRLFFDNLWTILLFAVVGTIFNTCTIGTSLYLVGMTGIVSQPLPILNVFVFSALISAVDPVAVLAVFEEIHVNEVLYIVVFGESLLNDGVSVVLYHMFEAYSEMGEDNILYTDLLAGLASFFVVALGGVLVGVIWGFLTGLVTRFTTNVPVIEPLFVFVMSYMAYLNAELFHLSGILSITFCGITMKNYVEANISAKSQTTVKYTMKMLSSSSETVIFMLLGVATVHEYHYWDTAFVLLTILFCSVYRTLGVIILSGLANRFRIHEIERVEKFVMSYGGLRGAIAFALVLLINPAHIPQQPMFLTTTVAVVYFTVFIQGITIKPLVELLGVKKSSAKEKTMNERIHERTIDHVMAAVEDVLGHMGRHYLRDAFKQYNNKYIRPFLIARENQLKDPKIIETYSRLAMKDAMDNMHRSMSSQQVALQDSDSMTPIMRSQDMRMMNASQASLASNNGTMDLKDRRYTPRRDLSDLGIHHLLMTNTTNPRQRTRRLSYSRHAVHDQDLSTRPVNHRVFINNRRRQEKIRRRKDNTNGKAVTFSSHGSQPARQNGVKFAQNEVAPKTNVHEGHVNKGFLDDNEGIVFSAHHEDNVDKGKETKETVPSVHKANISQLENVPKTAIDSVLPWKRGDEDSCKLPNRQTEFPTWVENDEYTCFNSPSSTFLGEVNRKYSIPASVIGLFGRDSDSRRPSIQSDLFPEIGARPDPRAPEPTSLSDSEPSPTPTLPMVGDDDDDVPLSVMHPVGNIPEEPEEGSEAGSFDSRRHRKTYHGRGQPSDEGVSADLHQEREEGYDGRRGSNDSLRQRRKSSTTQENTKL